MRIWTRKSALIQPRTSLRKSDVSWLAEQQEARARLVGRGVGLLEENLATGIRTPLRFTVMWSTVFSIFEFVSTTSQKKVVQRF